MAKVDVVTADDFSYGNFQWWSKWIDIAVVELNCEPFLIQMKVSRFNKKKFNAIKMNGKSGFYPVNYNSIGDLTPMNKAGK